LSHEKSSSLLAFGLRFVLRCEGVFTLFSGWEAGRWACFNFSSLCDSGPRVAARAEAFASTEESSAEIDDVEGIGDDEESLDGL